MEALGISGKEAKVCPISPLRGTATQDRTFITWRSVPSATLGPSTRLTEVQMLRRLAGIVLALGTIVGAQVSIRASQDLQEPALTHAVLAHLRANIVTEADHAHPRDAVQALEGVRHSIRKIANYVIDKTTEIQFLRDGWSTYAPQVLELGIVALRIEPKTVSDPHVQDVQREYVLGTLPGKVQSPVDFSDQIHRILNRSRGGSFRITQAVDSFTLTFRDNRLIQLAVAPKHRELWDELKKRAP
jgi:hypothetical protein